MSVPRGRTPGGAAGTARSTAPSTAPSTTPAGGAARWRASAWDYVVIVGWLAVLTVVGVVVRALLPPADADAAAAVSPLVVDVGAFAATVLPVWAYLTATEAGRRHATWGKRRAGLRVVAAGDGGPGVAPEAAPLGVVWVAVRNAVKLLPWQLAHIAVARILLEAGGSTDAGTDGGMDAGLEPGTAAVVGVTYTLSLVIPLVSIVMAWRDPLRRALHDRVAGTRVVRRP